VLSWSGSALQATRLVEIIILSPRDVNLCLFSEEHHCPFGMVRDPIFQSLQSMLGETLFGACFLGASVVPFGVESRAEVSLLSNSTDRFVS